MSGAIAYNLRRVLDAIAERAAACGRSPDSVRLVAVTKTMPPERIREAYDAGQRRFGENRAQELAAKRPVLPADCEWHFIGRLQKNKVRRVVRDAAWIHSVDSAALLQRVDRIAGEEQRRPRVLIEVNVSGEASKAGVSPDACSDIVAMGQDCANIDLLGLMTMAPFGATEEEVRSVFRSLRELRDRLRERFNLPLPELSMGMSSDYLVAIEEGATLVRVGSAIFGPRCV